MTDVQDECVCVCEGYFLKKKKQKHRESDLWN